MNRCSGSNTNAFASMGSDGVICPKPRRLRLLNPSNYQTESCDSRGAELLDMILTKPYHQVPSSPPFFMGSPPSRASNPVIQDAHFGLDKPSPLSPALESSPSSQRKNGGRVRVNFGQKAAAVRIEGFNCRGSCSVSAVA